MRARGADQEAVAHTERIAARKAAVLVHQAAGHRADHRNVVGDMHQEAADDGVAVAVGGREAEAQRQIVGAKAGWMIQIAQQREGVGAVGGRGIQIDLEDLVRRQGRIGAGLVGDEFLTAVGQVSHAVAQGNAV